MAHCQYLLAGLVSSTTCFLNTNIEYLVTGSRFLSGLTSDVLRTTCQCTFSSETSSLSFCQSATFLDDSSLSSVSRFGQEIGCSRRSGAYFSYRGSTRQPTSCQLRELLDYHVLSSQWVINHVTQAGGHISAEAFSLFPGTAAGSFHLGTRISFIQLLSSLRLSDVTAGRQRHLLQSSFL